MISYDALKKEQLKLGQNIILTDQFKKAELIAGIDQTYIGDDVISCIVVCDRKLKIIETKFAVAKAAIPYKPGFLAYRELTAMVEAYTQLDNEPDVIFVDGEGIMHPRKFGIASHYGLVISKPTIGISKIPIGEVKEDKVFLNKELCGYEVKTKEHSKPIYVSPGHLISKAMALKITKNCIKPPHKLPEPLHLAHKGARRKMKEMTEAQQADSK